MATRSSEDTSLLKITTQYRAKQGMVYELAAGAEIVNLHIRRDATAGEPGEWHVEARHGRLAGAVVIATASPSAAEALRKVGEAWNTRPSESPLPTFDWDAVAALLVSVKAL